MPGLPVSPEGTSRELAAVAEPLAAAHSEALEGLELLSLRYEGLSEGSPTAAPAEGGRGLDEGTRPSAEPEAGSSWRHVGQ